MSIILLKYTGLYIRYIGHELVGLMPHVLEPTPRVSRPPCQCSDWAIAHLLIEIALNRITLFDCLFTFISGIALLATF